MKSKKSIIRYIKLLSQKIHGYCCILDKLFSGWSHGQKLEVHKTFIFINGKKVIHISFFCSPLKLRFSSYAFSTGCVFQKNPICYFYTLGVIAVNLRVIKLDALERSLHLAIGNIQGQLRSNGDKITGLSFIKEEPSTKRILLYAKLNKYRLPINIQRTLALTYASWQVYFRKKSYVVLVSRYKSVAVRRAVPLLLYF